MSAIRFTCLCIAMLAATAGVVSAQPYDADRPSSLYAGGAPPLSASDEQALLAVLKSTKSGYGGSLEAAAGISDPLARRIAQWALADSGGASIGDEDALNAATPGWPRTDRRQVEADRQRLVEALDAEFQSGWTALTRYNNPRLADQHFARLQAMSQAPLTQSRALYWRGRAIEAMGDDVAALLFYAQAAQYPTTFYGQLAAAKTTTPVISLGHDPEITLAERAEFESREPVRAARLLAGIGAKDSFEIFVSALSDALPSAAQEALLVDLARGEGDPALAMRVVRNAARRGIILPERGYPLLATPRRYDAPEAAFVLGIVRQESSFDPMAHSGAGARGMMQLMPATARIVARRVGLDYGDLYDATYNMTLGSAYLGQLVSHFDGSYVMAAAAYNAGPGRPSQWAASCGDPRSASGDPVNFIECIPLDETRNYVMRVLEAMQVYRARLKGGTAPVTLAADLKRGGYGRGGEDIAQSATFTHDTGVYEPYPRPMGSAAPQDSMAPIPNP